MIRKKKPLVRLDLTATVGRGSTRASSPWTWVIAAFAAFFAVWLIWSGLSPRS